MSIKLSKADKILLSTYVEVAFIKNHSEAEFFFSPNYNTNHCRVMMRKSKGDDKYDTISFELPDLHTDSLGVDKWYTETELMIK